MKESAAREGNNNGSPRYRKVVFRRPLSDESRQLLRRLMRTSPFFSHMGEKDAAELLRFCSVKKIPAIHPVFSKGNVGDGFYIIVSGSIVIEPDEGQEFRLGPGELLGQMALVLDLPHGVNAWAEEETVLLFVPRFVLETGFCKLRATILESFARQFAMNLRRTEVVIENLTKTSRLGA